VVKVVVLVETVDRSRNVNGRIADVVPLNLRNQTGSPPIVMQQIGGVNAPHENAADIILSFIFDFTWLYTSGDCTRQFDNHVY
jgi:hypothetical protein